MRWNRLEWCTAMMRWPGEQNLDTDARLRFHQQYSGPLMEQLKAQLAEARTEPNSGLGKAISYLLPRRRTLCVTFALRKDVDLHQPRDKSCVQRFSELPGGLLLFRERFLCSFGTGDGTYCFILGILLRPGFLHPNHAGAPLDNVMEASGSALSPSRQRGCSPSFEDVQQPFGDEVTHKFRRRPLNFSTHRRDCAVEVFHSDFLLLTPASCLFPFPSASSLILSK